MKGLSNWMLITLFLLPILLLSTSCSNNVVDITTVSGPNETQCGGFDWKVKFKLKEKRQKKGWLIQEIDVAQVVHNCDGTIKSTFRTHYWEAWEIPANKDYPKLRDDLASTWDDNYRMPDRGRTFGYTKAIGTIKYFENVNLPATMVPNNPRTFAGILHADVNRPPFWNNSKKQDKHNFENEWNCCVNPPTKSYKSVPVIGGIPPKVDKNFNSNNRVSKIIHQAPQWTSACGPEEAKQLKEVSLSLASTSNSEIRSGIQDFIKVTGGNSDQLDQLSKGFLLLRAIFDLPNNYPITQVKTYGGWIRQSEDTDSNLYNLEYPIEVIDNGDIFFIGQFQGYVGSDYDLLGEFDYFNANFERRTF